MQKIVFDEPYRFVPPYRSTVWSALFKLYLRRYLRSSHGIAAHECRGLDRLRKSLAAGHGVLLAPNHCRPSDPMVMGLVALEGRTHLYQMASWHIFKQDRLTGYLARRLGAFSIYREGMDRAALNTAIEILDRAERPLVIFPEGVISRTNDRLGALMDGTAFIARSAAKRRARRAPAGRVVVHPVALKYVFEGDLDATLAPVLTEIEARLSWQPQCDRPLLERIARVGGALLALKEVEYFGRPQSGTVYRRLERLIDHLLVPLEQEWLKGPRAAGTPARAKNLRAEILPALVNGDVTEAERDRRWRQLADVYLAQQLACYPRGYLGPESAPERLLETVERFEEDLTDLARVHGPLKVVLQIGEAIDVHPERDRRAAVDPLMRALEERLAGMLAELAEEFSRGARLTGGSGTFDADSATASPPLYDGPRETALARERPV